MRVLLAIVALSGFLVWEAWSERARHKIAVLLERLPALFAQMTYDLTAYQLTMAKASEAMAGLLLTWYRESAVPPSPPEWIDVTGYTITRPGHPPQHLDAADVEWSPGGIYVDWAGWTWTQAPDDSWIDAYSGQGEELEALEDVIEEQRERIRRIR